MYTTQQRTNSMNASENKDSTQNQAVFEGIKETMLKEGVIPLEIIKYSDEIQEKKRLQDIFDNISTFTDTTAQTLESAIKKIFRSYSHTHTHKKYHQKSWIIF